MEEFQSCAPTKKLKFVVTLTRDLANDSEKFHYMSTNFDVESSGEKMKMNVDIGCGPTQKKPFITVMGKGDVPYVWVYEQAFGLNPAIRWSDVLAHPTKYHLDMSAEFNFISIYPNTGGGSLLFKLEKTLSEPGTLLQSHIEALNARVDAVLRQIT